MQACADSQWFPPEDAVEIRGALQWVPAFTCQLVSHRAGALAACATNRHPQLIKPASRLMFTPWVFGDPDRSMSA